MFKNSLVEQEYGIKTKHASSGNLQVNVTIERMHQVLGNLVRSYILQETYIDYSDPWMGILAAAAFAVRSTYHRTKCQILGILILGQDMILPINHIENWRLIRQLKQEK